MLFVSRQYVNCREEEAVESIHEHRYFDVVLFSLKRLKSYRKRSQETIPYCAIRIILHSELVKVVKVILAILDDTEFFDLLSECDKKNLLTLFGPVEKAIAVALNK